MESLGIDFRLIIVQIINFGLLFFLLSKFLYKPILRILDERKKRIEESLATAQKIEEERVKLEAEKEKQLTQAQQAGKALLEEMKQEGEKQKAEILKRAQEEVERMIQKGKEQLVLEKEALREKLQAELTDLSIALAEKILAEKVGKEKEKELLAQSLAALKRQAVPGISFPPAVPARKRKILPQAAQIASDFFNLLKRTKSLALLPDILANLESRVFTPAEVVTISPLQTEEQERIILTLEEIFGPNLKIQFRTDPKIAGGMVVKVGDKIFDSSLLGKAQQLRESL